MPQRAQRLLLPGPTGVLETLIEVAGENSAEPPPAVGVVCHPHPLYGGTLDNKVVHTLSRALHQVGIPTLRFNFRGVGQSTGEYGHGNGETQDALAVVAAARERWPAAEPWLLGFSFGGIVALRAAVQARAGCLVTVAPAVGRIEAGDAVPRCPWLLVQGDADEVIDPREVLEWAAAAQPSPQLRVLPGASHFFHGRLPELREAVAAFAREVLVAARRPGS